MHVRTICLAGLFEDGSEQKCHEERSSVQDSGTWVEVWNWFIWQESGQECTCLQFVWIRGLYSRWETRYFLMYRWYGTSPSIYLIIFLKVISKVLLFNITQKFTNLLVQLSIFLIDLFVGTYRLSSHARRAFVIQTELNCSLCFSTCGLCLLFSPGWKGFPGRLPFFFWLIMVGRLWVSFPYSMLGVLPLLA